MPSSMQKKYTRHIKDYYRCHCYKWNKTKTEKISTAVASIKQKQGARYRISSLIYTQTLQKHYLKRTAQSKESCYKIYKQIRAHQMW